MVIANKDRGRNKGKNFVRKQSIPCK